jgi:hypothetical protein
MNPIQPLDLISKLWPIFFATIGYVVWIIRLEMKVYYQDMVIKELKADFKEIKQDIKAINNNLSSGE